MGERYLRIGSCRRFCGNQCCSIHGFRGTPEYKRILKEFQESPFHGLKPNGECVHLHMKHGIPTCEIYEHRPEVCKQFPAHPRDIANIPECEFTFIAKPLPYVKPPEPIHPRMLLQYHECWPLFDLEKTILPVEVKDRDGHVVKTEERTFVVIQDLPPIHHRVDAAERLIEEVRRLEWKCWHQGIAGWIAGCDPENIAMQGVIVGYGARLYHENYNKARWFIYDVLQPPPMTGKGLDAYSPLPSLHDIQIGARAYARTQTVHPTP